MRVFIPQVYLIRPADRYPFRTVSEKHGLRYIPQLRYTKEDKMYGLVNKAVEQMVCVQFGEEVWETIKAQAGVDIDAFMSMEGYPDEVTYRLIAAASTVLNLPAAQVLEAFGEYWVRYTASEGYGELMQLAGSTLPEFLQNLDNLHARIGLTFTHLKPPSFQCTDATDDTMRLHYYSTREGLAHMVIGLLRGLGERFHTTVSVTQACDRSVGADHDEFIVQYHDKTPL